MNERLKGDRGRQVGSKTGPQGEELGVLGLTTAASGLRLADPDYILARCSRGSGQLCNRHRWSIPHNAIVQTMGPGVLYMERPSSRPGFVWRIIITDMGVWIIRVYFVRSGVTW